MKLLMKRNIFRLRDETDVAESDEDNAIEEEEEAPRRWSQQSRRRGSASGEAATQAGRRYVYFKLYCFI